ncbi:hypothetical protein [Flavicella sediminum]|uniref:hypothetical protein n=1 Tax=Flavicella sediminum TaxID=2585141 RepID=UPI00111FEB3A|nr:hypothetical protein [Flavicella sediminum]
MKTLIKIILFIVLGFLGTGIYLQQINDHTSEKYMGIGVLTLAFILLPLFVYHRYKGKDLTKYSFKNMQGPESSSNLADNENEGEK